MLSPIPSNGLFPKSISTEGRQTAANTEGNLLLVHDIVIRT